MNKLPIIKKANIPKIKSPLSGSRAKAWTEVNMPDLTKKVPSKLVAKANIDKRIDHLPKTPRFSLAIKEWNKATDRSQGMNAAFSTGSQNHQPPQPNS